VAFLSPSRYVPGEYLDKTTAASFQILSNSLFIHPTILAHNTQHLGTFLEKLIVPHGKKFPSFRAVVLNLCEIAAR
jgi:hypothetical protein